MNCNLSTNNTNMLNYEKTYNIYEIITLLENMPKETEVLCLNDKRRYILNTEGELYNSKNDEYINDNFTTKNLISLTFNIIKDENWIECDYKTALDKLHLNHKIKLGNTIYTKEQALDFSIEFLNACKDNDEFESILRMLYIHDIGMQKDIYYKKLFYLQED